MMLAGNPPSQAPAEESSVRSDMNGEKKEARLTPEQQMQKRFPQPVRVGFLVGLPVIDNNDNTIAYVQRVVRTPTGKIQLIVRYGGWFGWVGWWQRRVAVPIELVAMLGAQVAAIDMFPEDFQKAPTWDAIDSTELATDEFIRVALTKR
jgi:hypothetical protein